MLKTVNYLNDVLILGQTMEEHNGNLHAVLKRLQDAGLHLRSDKCEFKKSLISYLGHRIDSEGIHPTQEKVNTIHKAPIWWNCIAFSFCELLLPLFKQYQHCPGSIVQIITKRNSLEMGTRQSLCLWAIKEVAIIN